MKTGTQDVFPWNKGKIAVDGDGDGNDDNYKDSSNVMTVDATNNAGPTDHNSSNGHQKDSANVMMPLTMMVLLPWMTMCSAPWQKRWGQPQFF